MSTTDQEEFDDSAEGENITEESDTEDNDSESKKSTSNFKALYKSNKEKEKIIAQKEEELSSALEELKQWRELNADTAKELDKSKDVDSVKEEIFTLKNPDAEPYLKDIRATMSKYGMDYKDAWKFVKSDIPAESRSKKDFDTSGKTPAKSVDLSKVSEAESVNLSKEDRSKWRKLNGY